MQPNPGEKVLLVQAANIRKAAEYAGGQLTLTDKRLVVEPHKVNLDSAPVEIALGDIAAVEPFPVFGVVPTGMLIRLKSGGEQRLVVWGRKALIALIKQTAGI
jgi:hypothetical protein